MPLRNPRLRLLVLMVLTQVGCVGVGLLVHYRYLLTIAQYHQQTAAPLAPRDGALALLDSLPAAGLIAWAWTSVLSAVAADLAVKRTYDRLSRQQSQVEAEALKHMQSLVRTRDALIFGLASMAESRDEVTGRHLERVSSYASRLAIVAGREPKFRERITPEFVRLIGVSAVLHDIGKVGIEDEILFKPGPLNEAERARMQEHTTLGDNYLAELEQRLGYSPVIRMGREIARWHHERWDGRGYPDGLGGEEIPLAARIVAIVDVYEALTSLRDYKPPFSHERCIEIIRGETGRQFDPDLAAVFLRHHETFRQFAYQYGDMMCQGKADDAEVDQEDPSVCEGLVSTMKAMGEELAIPAVLRKR